MYAETSRYLLQRSQLQTLHSAIFDSRSVEVEDRREEEPLSRLLRDGFRSLNVRMMEEYVNCENAYTW